ncbi:eukaryotic translation initiation factor 5B [Diachasmimorpha longicaudata]|uniref:eukaryotic translation initiation factor 5B n=1 Tax=Diachasmimorpha longicaudata TaxID=58733 RepID=UPI0030B878CE
MPKVRKLKRKKTYKVSINRKRLRNKLRKVPSITCSQIKEAWNSKKSTKSNLQEMGLGYNPNHVLKVPNVKSALIKSAKRKASGELSESDEEITPTKRTPKKIQVARDLEAEARAPRERMFRLPKGQVLFLTQLMDKYGDDYEAMARDKKNYYQLTWRQIRQKINTFKNIPEQYGEYLVHSGDIVLDDPMTLEETRKKIAAENVEKYCKRKEKKEKRSVIGQWIEETIGEDEEDTFETDKTLEDDDSENNTEGSIDQSAERKLKLFPDEESDEEGETAEGKKAHKTKNGKSYHISKLSSSDSEDSEDLEGDDAAEGFRDLDDMCEEELSEDDILDDGEFVTDEDDSE